MTKDEIIEGNTYQLKNLEELRIYLQNLQGESLVVNSYVHGVMGFLLTAVDYLQTNIAEISNRVRMS